MWQASWADAASELLGQYEEVVRSNLPLRQERATIVVVVTQICRAVLFAALAFYLLRTSYLYKLLLPMLKELRDELGLG